jgi:CheY-like chemotaxis protein
MSPEQVRGGLVDARSDVFSLGCLLFEMLTGRPPFREKNLREMLRALVQSPTPRLPATVESPYAADLQRIIDDCLAKEAEKRPSSAEVADALRLVLSRLRGLPPPEAAPAAVADPPPRRLRVVLVDDDELSRTVLRECLPDLEVEILAECADGFAAAKAVRELRPDLLVMDVDMPKLNGFEVMELVGHDVGVIFVTAHEEYQSLAYDQDAIDYVVKPVEPLRMEAALARARERLHRR